MSKKTILRLIVLALVSWALMMVGRYTPLAAYFSFDGLSEAILDAGGFGVVVFILIYAVGTLMNVPGVVFLFIIFMIYPGVEGILIGGVATLVAMIVHFYFVRLMAGKALKEIEQPFIVKMMRKMTDRPIMTTVILRLILFVSPPVNYALALSPIKAKNFILGSVIALPLNILFNYFLMTVAKEQLMRWFL